MERTGYCLIDGDLVAEAEAAVPVRDRGLLYGDGVFETLRAYRGRAFRLGEHWARLSASAAFLGIGLPALDPEDLVARLLRANGLGDATVRVTLTRGDEPSGPRPGKGAGGPRLLAQARPLRPGLGDLARSGGAGRRLPWPLRARGLPLHVHKTLAYLPSVLALGRVGPDEEPLLENVEGHVAEGATSNVFWVAGGRLRTPALEAGCLPGIARGLVLGTAREQDRGVEEGLFPWADLASAEEAFLTNSVVEVVPLVRLDGAPLGSGEPGPVTRSLQAAYRARVEDEVGG